MTETRKGRPPMTNEQLKDALKSARTMLKTARDERDTHALHLYIVRVDGDGFPVQCRDEEDVMRGTAHLNVV